ncbi:M56 family metallopeptidase [Flavivirga rizhaonensis]|uniref:Peptidase M56 domain-containing protein n=1 Tax=Flavivirga rizhaonensis TaxID=2559571 RepID=A0A4S1DY07_9FLAO|nr:M56 family metallopeptidase [Flavivirga rizhaonensis]TGV03060.1 hypothetical protein EM932_08735 [Flavivirga rizhaonensis]
MEYLLKASSLIAIFYFIYKVFLQHDTFFQSNRGFLLLGLISSFIIPLFVIPVYIEYVPTVIENYSLDNAFPTVKNIEEPFNILDYLPIVYLSGILFFFCRFIIQLVSLFRLIFKNKSEKLGVYKFVNVNTEVSPFSFFNWIVYNLNQFTKTELDQIITHEKVHVRQYHSIDILLTQLSCIVLWFNPLIWLYSKDIKQNLEFIADQKAQYKFNCKKSYQTTLLKTSIPSNQMVLSNNFYNSLIKKRIIMLHKSKSKKINLIKYVLVIPLLVLFLMSFNTEEIYRENSVLNSENVNSINQEVTDENDIEKFLIYNNFTDEKLKSFKAELKSKGYDFKLKSIKRKTNNLITTIDFTISKNGIDATYRIASGVPVKTIVIEYSKNKKKFSINTLDFLEDEKRNVNNPDLIEIIIDKNTTISELVNKKRFLKEKYNIIFNFKIFEQNSDGIAIYSYEIGKKGTLHSTTTTSVDNPMIIKYNPKTNSITRQGINKNGDPTYGTVSYLDNQKKFIIKSDYSDKSLESASKRLKEKGITVKFSDVKRNNQGDIISIKVNAKSEYGNVNYNQDSREPIPPIAISYYGNGKRLGLAPFKKDIHKMSKKNKTSVVSESISNTNYKPDIIEKLIRESKGKSIYILDEKKITEKELRSIDEKKISSIKILKGESATKKYGDKGKNGVVEITTKKD